MARASASFSLRVPTGLVSKVPSGETREAVGSRRDEGVMKGNEMRREADEWCVFIKLSIHSSHPFFLENYGYSLKNKRAYNHNTCQVTVHVRGGDPLLFTQN